MDRDLIRSWLQLPPGDWPPDHYTLLGLEPGESDSARVEQQVHERMQRLRSYQLTHPELATEAMNRLAQALVCLTDPEAKRAYDRELFSEPPAEPRTEPVPAPSPAALPSPATSMPGLASAPPAAPAGGSADRFNGPFEPRDATSWQALAPIAEDLRFFDWQTAPPPLRLPANEFGPAPLGPGSKETTENSTFPSPGARDTLTDAPAMSSAESGVLPSREEILANYSRQGLRSRGALYYHIARTRQLLWAWEQVGKYLGRPGRLVSRPAEATDLIHHMGVIRELLPSSTARLGEAGQPGYLVLALARQQMIVPTLQTLLPSQREALARDWQAGHALLRSVRQFLREELHIMRKRPGWRHVLRLVGVGVRDHPGAVLLVLAWVAINLAIPSVLARWPEQLICLVALVGLWFACWLYSLQPIRIRPAPRLERKIHLPRGRPKTRRQPNSSRV
jgi:hypothetical protein